MKRKTIEPTSTPDIDAETGNLIEEILSDNEELYRRLARREEFASALSRVIDEDRELRVLKVPGNKGQASFRRTLPQIGTYSRLEDACFFQMGNAASGTRHCVR